MGNRKKRKGDDEQVTIDLLKARIAEIDALLDTNIADDEFDALMAEAARLTAELGKEEQKVSLRSAKELTKVTDWTRSFLSSFANGTRVITNRQADCFRRINNGKPFIFEGRRFDCSGPNYRAGFSNVVVTRI